MVDGTNLPARIDARNCPVADCPNDLNHGCKYSTMIGGTLITKGVDILSGPGELQKKDRKGGVAGCLSSCAANLDGNPGNSVRSSLLY